MTFRFKNCLMIEVHAMPMELSNIQQSKMPEGSAGFSKVSLITVELMDIGLLTMHYFLLELLQSLVPVHPHLVLQFPVKQSHHVVVKLMFQSL